MSSHASHAGPGAVQRFADQFGKLAVVLLLLGGALALVLTVPPSWVTGIFSKDDAAASTGYTQLDPAPPVQLSAAGIGLAAPLIAADSNPGAMLGSPPDDAPLVSWYADGGMPGVTKGQTLLIAHTDGTLGGLTRIGGLEVGSTVDVLTENGTMRYEVDRVRTLSDAKMDQAKIALFKQDGGYGRLVMVSQEEWDGAAYARSVVVTAVPLGRPQG